MTVLFRNLRIAGYFTVLLLAGGVLGIASYFASQFLPTIRFSFTTFSLVVPSFTIAALLILLYESRPWIDALILLTTSISWLALAAWSRDINGAAECDALGPFRTQTAHGSSA
jgi:membrane-associated HD superfamily phosphohydrolase